MAHRQRARAARMSPALILVLACLVGVALALEAPPTFVLEFGSLGNGDGQLAQPVTAAESPSGEIYVTDFNNGRIQVFDANGVFQRSVGVGDLNPPHGIVFADDGGFYVAQFGPPEIVRFDATDSVVDRWSVGSPNHRALDVELSPNGAHVYVSLFTPFNIDVVKKYTTAGTFVTEWGGDGLPFIVPRGLATDAAGNVYVTDQGNHRVQKFDADGTYVSEWGAMGSGDGQFNSPGGISVNAAGAVLITDILNRRVQVFDAAGMFLTKWGSLGNGDGEFADPLDVNTAADGSIYVADTLNHRVQKFAPPPDETIDADIDIKPGGNPNPINLRKNGRTPVALLGSDNLAVSDVDTSTLLFEGAEPAHDLTDPFVWADHVQNINDDGHDDLILHFLTQETGIVPGQAGGCLTGETTGGTEFEGCDSIRTIPAQ